MSLLLIGGAFGAILGLAVGFYLGVAYGAPAWLDWAAEQRKRREG
jgi:hypothetical protein